MLGKGELLRGGVYTNDDVEFIMYRTVNLTVWDE